MQLRASKTVLLLGAAIAALAILCLLWVLRAERLPWWKGNVHTHSLWSDGDQFPEMIADWYKQHGYHFLALSDHDVLAEGVRWVQVADDPRADEVLARYVERFGAEWVGVRRLADGTRALRLKTLEEYRSLLEEEGRFLMIQAEEITGKFGEAPIHVSATNVQAVIEGRTGATVREALQKNVDAVLEQRERTGQIMLPHVPHPNFKWLVTAEDLIALEGDRFFEVYNGHPAANNYGDDQHPSSEQIWDVVLSERLALGKDVLYALAVDDAHQYQAEGLREANPGRGWIMVRAPELTAEALLAAMEAGDFYATTGVELDDVDFDDDSLALEIRPEEGVSYVTRFIGTRRGGDDVGVLLAAQGGVSPRYELTGDEIYVRAKVISSELKANPYRAGEHEVAWTQPFVPAR